MQSIQFQLWNEKFTLNEAFSELMHMGAENPTLKELVKGMLFQRSFGEYQINIDDKAVENKLLEQFSAKLKQATKEELKSWLKKTNQTEEGMIKRLVYQEQINRLKQIVISQESLREAFIKRKSRLDKIMFSLIRVEKESMAQELFYRIRDDHHDFGDLAIKFSIGPEASFGGIIGPKPIIELNTELKKHLLSLNHGEVTEPFTLDGKLFFIAKLIRMETAQLTQALENEIREELFEQWVERQLGLADIKTSIIYEIDNVSSGKGVNIS